MKWTPLFTFEAELGREAPAHSGRGSSRVRPSIVFPIPGPGAGVYGWCHLTVGQVLCHHRRLHTSGDSRAPRLGGRLCFLLVKAVHSVSRYPPRPLPLLSRGPLPRATHSPRA